MYYPYALRVAILRHLGPECRWMTLEQIKAALGVTLLTAEQMKAAGFMQCCGQFNIGWS